MPGLHLIHQSMCIHVNVKRKWTYLRRELQEQLPELQQELAEEQK